MPDSTVPSPRTARTAPSYIDNTASRGSRSDRSAPSAYTLPSIPSRASPPSATSHQRRPSLTMPPLALQTSPVPLPVPQRHGSFHGASPDWGPGSPRARTSTASSPSTAHAHLPGHGYSTHSRNASAVSTGSASLPASMYLDPHDGDESWLDITADTILRATEEANVPVIDGSMGVEEAVEILLKGDHSCLLVWQGASHAFFDHADLNTFLLLVLQASSGGADGDDRELDPRANDLVRRLRSGVRFGVEAVCDISQKDPYHAFASSTPIRTLLPLFSSGLHRVAVLTPSPKVLSSAALLTHLLALPSNKVPALLSRPIGASGIPLHPLISLPGTASVLDAMQVMSLSGLSALGVLAGAGVRHRRGSSASHSSGSSGTTQGSRDYLNAGGDMLDVGPRDELVGVVTVRDCARLVVPSEGRQVLGMGLERMCKAVQVVDEPGRERGEERTPIHTVTHAQTLLHVAHLLFATSSSRVLLRLHPGVSPPLSPVPSLSLSAGSPASSPSISSLSLQDEPPSPVRAAALPRPPATLLSPHSVISVLDILACLARAYRARLGPSTAAVVDVFEPDGPTSDLASPGGLVTAAGPDWDLDPEAMAKRRRASSGAGAGSRVAGFENWRWARSVRS